MRKKLNTALNDALRSMGRPVSEEELRQRGGQLRAISGAKVSRMIEQAVNRTLMQRTLNVSPDELRQLVYQARGEWKRLLQAHRVLSASRAKVQEDKRELEDVLARLQEERGSGDGPHRSVEELLAESEERGARREDQLEHELRGLVRSLASGADARHVEEEVVRRSIAALRATRAQAREERLRLHTDQVDKLERRVAKLLESLEETEEMLRRLQASRTMDEGLPSLYRVVQGLSEDEENRALKKELMAAIFEANLTLQREGGLLSAAPAPATAPPALPA